MLKHTAGDTKDALHFPTIDNINNILRVFVCEYLHISPWRISAGQYLYLFSLNDICCSLAARKNQL